MEKQVIQSHLPTTHRKMVRFPNFLYVYVSQEHVTII